MSEYKTDPVIGHPEGVQLGGSLPPGPDSRPLPLPVPTGSPGEIIPSATKGKA